MSELECKFCAGVAPNVTGSKVRGSGPWKGYTFESLGHHYLDNGVPRTPPTPPEVRGRKLAAFKRIGGDKLPVLLNGCRITHESGLDSITHWWPSHGIKTEVWNLGGPASGDLLKKIINLFMSETRGAPEKLSEAVVAKAVQRLGDRATQRAVARKLGVTPRALQLWAAKNNLGGWASMKKSYAADEQAAN